MRAVTVLVDRIGDVGGAERYWETVLPALASRGIAVRLLARELSPDARFGDAISARAIAWADEDGGADADAARAVAAELRRLTLAIYSKAAQHAEACGLILADTKFEFGTAPGGIMLADEVLTPDSSRFWEAASWKPGGPQPSFDKQFVRDYLESIHWNKQAPAPGLPDDVVERTQAKYLEAFRRLTGRDLVL